MTTFYFVDDSLPVRDAKGALLKVTTEQYMSCLVNKNKNIHVYENIDDAIDVANDGVKEGDIKQYPIFTLEYAGKGRNASYELDNGDKVPAKIIPFNKAKVTGVSLEHVDHRFKAISLAEKAEQKSEHHAKHAPSRGSRFLSGVKTVARPSVIVGVAAGAGTYFLNGLSYVPSILSNFIGTAARTVFPKVVPAEIAVAATAGVATLASTEVGQRVASQAYKHVLSPVASRAHKHVLSPVASRAHKHIVSPLWNYARSKTASTAAVSAPTDAAPEVVVKKKAANR